MSSLLRVVCLFAIALAVLCADDKSAQPQVAPPTVAAVAAKSPEDTAAPAPAAADAAPEANAVPDASGLLGSLGPAGQAIAHIHQQQLFSAAFGKAFLGLHIAATWSQIANSWATQALQDSKSEQSNFRLFEEDASSFEDDTTRFLDNLFCTSQVSCKSSKTAARSLEEGFPYSVVSKQPVADVDAKQHELQGEQQVTYLTKLWHITAASKLADAQRTHYQTKIQLAMLQPLASHPMVSQLVYLAYYKDILNTISSAIAIEKQDAWSRWALLDSLETTTSAESDPVFLKALVTAQFNAMKLLHNEALIEVQMMWIDFVVQSIVARVSAPPHPAATSFLEEEAMAQPEKPFFPFAMGNPAYFQQYISFLRLYSKYMYFSATQYLYWSAHLDLVSSTSPSEDAKADQYGSYSVAVFSRLGLPLLYSWAQTNLMLSYLDMFQLYSVLYQARAMRFNAMHLNNNVMLQTEAPHIENEPARA